MGKALYRKYRSRSLDEIVGQPHITAILRRAIANGTTAHAYLLTGPRGVGKTSIARILAHEINQLPYNDESTHLDIIEIDAASNNSVEDIRDLREKVQVAPARAPKKIYIIDEVHMLSKSAFNALLKTLEEPPEHVVFILATTDADRLPATILSRVQRFNFRTISQDEVAAHLRTIADSEQIDITDQALQLIAQYGQGSFRDSISLLDQMQNLSSEKITAKMVEDSLGLANTDEIRQLLDAYRIGDLQSVADTLHSLESRGVPANAVSDQLIHQIRRDVTDRVDCLPLADRLLSAQKTAWPYVKLLVSLSSNTAPTPQQAQTTVVNEPAPAYTSQPTARKFDKPHVKKEAEKTPHNSAELPPKNTAATDELPAKNALQEKRKNTKLNPATTNFDWTKFLRAVRQNAAGAHSFLVNSGYTIDDQQLTIFAGKKFAKNQIEKSMPVLAEALQSQNIDREIVVSTKAKPPKDSQTAAVLDIMGGGEEVKL